MRPLSLLAVSAAAALAVTLLAARPAAPAFGPGAVLEMHRALFKAIDSGDAEKAAALVDSSGENSKSPAFASPSVYLVDANGLPVSARNLEETRALLAQLARASRDGGPEWSTTIQRSQADCGSPDLSCVVLELERSRGVKGGVRHYRSTSLVRWTDAGFRLVHWHVSPADEPTARAIADAR